MQSTTIESRDNAVFKDLKKLTSSQGINRQQRFLLAGAKLTSECLQQQPNIALKWLHDSRQSPPSTHPELPAVGFATELFKELDVLGTKAPLLLCQKPEIPQWNSKEHLSGLSLLCAASDPQNLGAITRSALAFGAERMILLQEAANPFLPKTMKSSSGACLKMAFLKGPSLQQLPKLTQPLLALDMSGEVLQQHTWEKDCLLLLGEEGQGLPANLPENTKKLSIPLKGNVESLNVAVSAAIALYEWQRRG